MIKVLVTGVWICIVTLGSIYMAQHWQHAPPSGEAETPSVLDLITPAPITVPVVNGAAVAGYVVAQFSYSVDNAQLKGGAEILEPIAKDEAFRAIYGGDAGDFSKPKKSDLARLSKSLLASINTRLKGDVVKDVLIEELVYVPKDKTRGGGGALKRKQETGH